MEHRLKAADGDRRHLPIVLAGLPRAGTTWAAQVLGRADGTTLVHEPDNAKLSLASVAPTTRHGRFPLLRPGEAAWTYQRLWASALRPTTARRAVALRLAQGIAGPSSPSRDEAAAAGSADVRLLLGAGIALVGPRLGPTDPARRPVVKTVHAPLALEWVTDAFTVRTLVVLRHPANVLASWLELELPDADRALDRDPQVRTSYVGPWGLPDPGPGPLARAVWQLGLLTAALEDAASRHPEWIVTTHEDLCADPHDRFRRIYGGLDLAWGDDAEGFLAGSDRPGTRFETSRLAAEQAGRWRQRLGREALDVLVGTLSHFPLRRWRFDTVDALLRSDDGG